MWDESAASGRVSGTLRTLSPPFGDALQPAERTDGFPSPVHRSHVPAPSILWIDDEIRADGADVSLLNAEGFSVRCAPSGAMGLSLALTESYAAIVLDLVLPDMYGLTVLQRLVSAGVVAPVLVLTGRYSEHEVEDTAIRTGAAAFVHKPFFADELALKLRAVITDASLSAAPPRRDFDHGGGPCGMTRGLTAVGPQTRLGIVGDGPSARAILQWVHRVGPTSANVLITGETGTGKELVARAIHRISGRDGHAFVPINCGSIPESLLESELFGCRKGAFTGAVEKAGLVEMANQGTLFLDEIAEMPVPMQVRLLRFLENGEVRRLGETKARQVDVRVIAASNRPLRDCLARGAFREDLYYRLAVLELSIPPLRDRVEDVELLVTHWLPYLAQRHGRRITGISREAVARLRAYSWPGNVRELRNILERSLCLASDEVVTDDDVSSAMSFRSTPTAGSISDAPVCRNDMSKALAALEVERWNRTRTARRLGISRTTLWRRLKRHAPAPTHEC